MISQLENDPALGLSDPFVRYHGMTRMARCVNQYFFFFLHQIIRSNLVETLISLYLRSKSSNL